MEVCVCVLVCERVYDISLISRKVLHYPPQRDVFLYALMELCAFVLVCS